MKQRDVPPELEKNIGKTMIVQNTRERGPGVPGFYCETCNRTYKDSNAYLDHINGRARESSLVISQSNRPSLTIDRLTRSGPNDKDKG
jgi:U4/U6.U5 tri-snRNP component SNU23